MTSVVFAKFIGIRLVRHPVGLRCLSTMAIAGLGLVLFLVATPAEAQEQVTQGTYQIAAGDVLDIIVWRNKELTMTVTVRPDGWISFPLISDVRVTGMTPMQLQKALEEALVKSVSSPMITVVVSKVAGFRISILGKVRQPGRYDVEQSATVLDVLALAGGPNDYADTSAMYVLRRLDPGDGSYQRIPVSYASSVSAGKGNTNVAVKAGDIVIVP